MRCNSALKIKYIFRIAFMGLICFALWEIWAISYNLCFLTMNKQVDIYIRFLDWRIT